jgi:exodeoxyribonuclease V alpha subunit
VDLARIRDTAAVDGDEPVDLGALSWPEPADWLARVAASGLVTGPDRDSGIGPDSRTGPDYGAGPGLQPHPLRLQDSWLYLDRYWSEELQVAGALLAMSQEPAAGVDLQQLQAGLGRLFESDDDERQRQAAAAAVRQRFAVVAGGPGTGKTTTVARIVALLCEQAQAAGRELPLIALAAPTGKAAARLQEAVQVQAATMAIDETIRARLLELEATTLHRLLGWRPGSNSRFRHNRAQRLPHDVVIIDETSMVSLSLMARLIEALRGGARLVLVGDPGQLASIEAGAVLGDIVGPAADRRADPAPGFGQGIVVLERGHRFGGGIAELAMAIRRGEAERVLELLADPPEGIHWIEAEAADEAALAPVREGALQTAHDVIEAAAQGEAQRALQALGRFRILCAHRRGPYGVASWTARLEGWLADAVEGFASDERWYVGRPLLVTENDYELRLNNGDTGVIMRSDERVVAAFERGGEVVEYSPSRLGAIETVYAMTIHKSQGSQFDRAAVLLPEPDSRILTRELLYTAATRAREGLIIVGPAESVRAAVQRPVARASGLRWRLWGA